MGVVVSIVGPTASGKTELAVALARHLQTEIVNADARQVYRGMAIGTAQPSPEELAAAKHHFVDFLAPSELFSAGAFEAQAVPVLNRLCAARGSAVLAGGSGMYVEAALRGLDPLPADLTLRHTLNGRLKDEGLTPLLDELRTLDPDHADRMDTSNPQRVVRALEVCLTSGKPFSSFHHGEPKSRPWRVVSIGLNPERGELRKRVATRAHAMMEAGWLEEAKALLPHRHENALNTVGYKELFEHLDGKCTLDEAVEWIVTRTRQFAKRQMTWFKKDPATTWFDYAADTRQNQIAAALAFGVEQVRALEDSGF